jgi:hypothetical protein
MSKKLILKIINVELVDPDPDVWGRIRILALLNDPISTILVCVKATNTSEIS